jgi:hypothetical protein
MAKSKFKEIYCTSCKRMTKMVILKEPEDNKGWFQCSRCRHSFCIDLSTINDEKKDSKEIPEREDCIEYTPDKAYMPGDGIFHAEWDDTGRVESKEVISSGNSVIVVKFKKSGIKKLVENLHVDSESVSDNETLELNGEKPVENTLESAATEESVEGKEEITIS